MADITIRVVDCYVFRQTNDDLSFLLLKRNKDKLYEHLWQGVAGKIEGGETLEPVRMFVADHVSRFYESHQDRINLVPVFGIEVDSSEVKLSKEHVDYKWVDIYEALDTLVWRGQKESIQTVYDMVVNNDGRMRWSKVEF